MPRDLDALLLTVRDEESFREFIAALAGDYSEEREIEAATPSSPYSAGALGWEHGSIDGYLGAAAACGSNRPSPHSGEVETAWFRAAAVMYAGKYYE